MNRQRSESAQRNRIVSSRQNITTAPLNDKIQPMDVRFVKATSNEATNYGEKPLKSIVRNKKVSSNTKLSPSRLEHKPKQEQHPKSISPKPRQSPAITQRHHVVHENERQEASTKSSKRSSKPRRDRSKSVKKSNNRSAYDAILSPTNSQTTGKKKKERRTSSAGEASSSMLTREEQEIGSIKKTIEEASDENEGLLNDIQETISKCEVLAHKREKILKENDELQQKQESMVEQLQELQEQLSHQSPSSVIADFDEVSYREQISVNKGKWDLDNGRVKYGKDVKYGGENLMYDKESSVRGRKLLNTTGSSVLAERRRNAERNSNKVHQEAQKDEIKGAVAAINVGDDEVNSQMLSNLLKNFLALLHERNNLKIELKQAELADLAQMEQHTKDSLRWLREKQSLLHQIQCQADCLQGLRGEIESLKQKDTNRNGTLSMSSSSINGSSSSSDVNTSSGSSGANISSSSGGANTSSGSSGFPESSLSSSFSSYKGKSSQSSGSGTSSGQSREGGTEGANGRSEKRSLEQQFARLRSKQRSHPSLNFERDSPLTINSAHTFGGRANNNGGRFAVMERRKSESAAHRPPRASTPIRHLWDGSNHGTTDNAESPLLSRYVNLPFPIAGGTNNDIRRSNDVLQTTARGGQEERDRRKALRTLLRMSTIAE